MTYSRMLKQHGDSGAEVTVATIEIPAPQAAKQFGVIEPDKDWRIIGFEEKPAVPKESPHHAGHCNASMGIYIFNTHLLIPILLADSEDPKSSHDFGKDILPRIISKHRVFAFNFVDEIKSEYAILGNDARKNIFAEIVGRLGIFGIGEQDGSHQVGVEDIDAHGSVALSGVVGRLLGIRGLFLKADNAPLFIDFDHAKLARGLVHRNLDGGHGNVRAGIDVLLQHAAVIHFVDVIAGKD